MTARCAWALIAWGISAVPSSSADPDIAALLQGADRRAAWERLVERGPAVLPALLDAMDSKDTAAVNWLRTAFDRIVDREMQAGSKRLDVDLFQKYAQDASKSGRARRLALQLTESMRPGTRARLLPDWINDPEFRGEAIEGIIQAADKLPPMAAIRELERAFAAARDIEQARSAAARLDKLGVKVSTARHLGFILDWHVIGPFDGASQTGFKREYPPESNVVLTTVLPGRGGELRWKRHLLKEPNPSAGGRFGLINLLEPLGTHHDAVAYAFTTIRLAKAVDAEFRGAADDNFSAWVNGKKAFAFEEYRNGVRQDRHRFRVGLKAGDNTILLKICQAPLDPASPESNWEFLLRVVDLEGRGLTFTQP